MTSHTSKWKQSQVSELKKLLDQYSVVAIANLKSYPSNLFSEMRKKLKGKALVRVSKTRVVQRALSESKKFSPLGEFAEGKSVAIIFSSINPFELYGFLKKNKGQMFAKEGDVADEEIIIPAGDSGLPPGPAMSELKAAGLQIKVAGPTIEITADKVVAKKGEAISAPVAALLSKLNVKPIRVGLNLVAAQEGTDLFKPEVLDIDLDQVFADFMAAHRNAFNLAVNAAYPTPETMEVLVVKAFREAKAVALEASIVNEVTAGEILAKASRQAQALENALPGSEEKSA
ncbi:MAG: 50S ribosomal protein L10 [Candidatus Diapherotrites archaeon]|nr:50S ribosomal protein L10 [Candidatus Diapherotrites archaeon]